jgi:hypothetical protein
LFLTVDAIFRRRTFVWRDRREHRRVAAARLEGAEPHGLERRMRLEIFEPRLGRFEPHATRKLTRLDRTEPGAALRSTRLEPFEPADYVDVRR